MGTIVHVPALPASAHDWQVPVQLLRQHTSCWQRPDAHSVPITHAVPGVFLEHTPVLQTFGLTQSAFDAHMVRHCPEGPQLYVPHDEVVAGWHMPVPPQVRGDECVDPVQAAAAHWVPPA